MWLPRVSSWRTLPMWLAGFSFQAIFFCLRQVNLPTISRAFLVLVLNTRWLHDPLGYLAPTFLSRFFEAFGPFSALTVRHQWSTTFSQNCSWLEHCFSVLTVFRQTTAGFYGCVKRNCATLWNFTKNNLILIFLHIIVCTRNAAKTFD